MKDDTQIKSVQNQIGKVQGQMRENIELAMQRQENLDVLADKSSHLQESASQFSQVASRIREDQQLQQYKFYGMLLISGAALLLVFTQWASPGRLIGGLVILGAAAAVILYLINQRKQGAIRLADSIATKQQASDIESGRE